MHTTYANVDFSALIHNFSRLRAVLSPGCLVTAVVKANAYGHGAVEISRALAQHGISRLAVASVAEGVALRKAGITADILVMVDLFDEQIDDLLIHRLTPVITETRLLPTLAKAAEIMNLSLPIHIKVDTGMARLGFAPNVVPSLLESLPSWKSLRVEGLMTHLSDSDGDDPVRTEKQLERFRNLLDQLGRRGITVPVIHAANSAAIIRFPHSHFTSVRPGIMLYGYHTLPAGVSCPLLKPVLSLHTTVMQLRTIQTGESVSYNNTFIAKRTTTIAVLPIGYADGYSRRLSNNGHVLIHGRRAPIVGLVCMDMTMVDVSDIATVRVGDEVTVIGRQGEEEVWANDIAEWTGTIPYEVLCAIGPRVPRIYLPA
ncbi:alanine racemase [Petrachloros mirabilis]